MEPEPTPERTTAATAPPTESTYSATDGDPATEAQVEAVKLLCQELQVPPAKIKEALVARGVEKLAELTVGRIDEIITKLNRRKCAEAASDRF